MRRTIDWRRAPAATPFVVAVFGALLLVALRGANPFPVTNDHAYFLPASWWLEQTGRLANPWLQGGFDQSLNWHGFLQPWLVGKLGGWLGGDWTGVYHAVDLLAATTIVLTAFIAHALGVSPLRNAAIVLIALGLSLDVRSRPEMLATLEMILLVALTVGFARTFPQPNWRAPAIGALFAALGVSHPALAAVAALGFAATLAVRFLETTPIGRAGVLTLFLLSAGFVATLGLLFTLVFCDGVGVWFEGMAQASAITLARSGGQGFFKYFLANRFLPGFVLVLLPAALALWALMAPPKSSHAPVLRWSLLVVVFVLSAFVVYRIALRSPEAYYNLTGLLVAAWLVIGVATLSSAAQRITDATLAIAALGAMSGAALWAAQSLAEWPLVASTRAELSSTVLADQAAGRKVCADSGALAALDSAAAARAVAISLRLAGTPAAPDPAACDIYFALQSQDSAMTAPAVEGFTLTSSARHASVFARLGLRPTHFGFSRFASQQAKEVSPSK